MVKQQQKYARAIKSITEPHCNHLQTTEFRVQKTVELERQIVERMDEQTRSRKMA
jgi:hypothetical protein